MDNLSPIQAYILLVLRDQTLHGYAIHREIEERFKYEYRLTSIYNRFNELVNLGLITRQRIDGDSRRTCAYSITRLGRNELEIEVRRMKRFIMASNISNGCIYTLNDRVAQEWKAKGATWRTVLSGLWEWVEDIYPGLSSEYQMIEDNGEWSEVRIAKPDDFVQVFEIKVEE